MFVGTCSAFRILNILVQTKLWLKKGGNKVALLCLREKKTSDNLFFTTDLQQTERVYIVL